MKRSLIFFQNPNTSSHTDSEPLFPPLLLQLPLLLVRLITMQLLLNSPSFFRCPNPADGTVEVLQNGISTVARFSFRMFTFTNFSSIYLHCQVHLCLLSHNNCSTVSANLLVCFPCEIRRTILYTNYLFGASAVIHSGQKLHLKTWNVVSCSIVTLVTTQEWRGIFPFMTLKPSH